MIRPLRPSRETRGKRGLLLRVEGLGRRRYGWVFLAVLVAVGASAWLGSRLQLESDVLELIPGGHRQVDAFKKALRDFGSAEFLIVVLEVDDDGGTEDLYDFADLLADRLGILDGLVELVEYRFQPDATFLRLFSENALLFLPPERLPEMEAKLTDAAIARQVRENRLTLASPTAALSEGLVINDPLGLMPFFVQSLLAHRGALQLDLSEGYYLSRDGRTLLMLVKPERPSQDLEFDRELLEAAGHEVEAVRRELAEASGVAGPSSVRVRFGGNHAMALEEANRIRQDVRFNLLFSLFAVSALYWLCYRRFAALLYSSIPLLVGQALTFGLAFLALGRLNSASSAFTALLMGLGTDFSIVMYARYVEERRKGATLEQASAAMVGETGLGVLTGAVTSAGTFYAMCVSRFGGLFDLGLLIGTGILLCAVASFFMLPAMITWNEAVRPRKADALGKLHLQSFGLEHLMAWSARHPRAAVALVGAATAAGAWSATGLEFDDSIRSLRSNRSESVRVQEKVAETFGASLTSMMVVSQGATIEEAVARAAAVERRLGPFLEDGTIGSYESILTYLPPVERQRRVIEAVQAGRDDAFSPVRIRSALLHALEENGFRREPFEEYLERMQLFLTPERPLALEDFEAQGLGRLVDRYVHRQPGSVRVVTYLYPTDPRYKRIPPPGIEDSLSAGDLSITVTGTNVVGRELRRVFSRDAVRSVSAGLVLVFVLLVVDFRSLRRTAVAMAQLLAGVVMMFGAMRLLGIPINYVNAFVATMIIGVGIDYSIHLVHRMHWNGGRVDQGTLETGKAVVMAALTNVAGFGTLTLGNYPALRSFGAVALLGSVTCLLTALVLVPAMMSRESPAPEAPVQS
jgi:uncharacterized protein